MYRVFIGFKVTRLYPPESLARLIRHLTHRATFFSIEFIPKDRL